MEKQFNSSAVLSIGGVVIGEAMQVGFTVPSVPVEAFSRLRTSFEFIAKATKATARALEVLVNPGINDFYHWQRVKLAQERRRLQRRQGRS